MFGSLLTSLTTLVIHNTLVVYLVATTALKEVPQRGAGLVWIRSSLNMVTVLTGIHKHFFYHLSIYGLVLSREKT